MNFITFCLVAGILLGILGIIALTIYFLFRVKKQIEAIKINLGGKNGKEKYAFCKQWSTAKSTIRIAKGTIHKTYRSTGKKDSITKCTAELDAAKTGIIRHRDIQTSSANNSGKDSGEQRITSKAIELHKPADI